jgi:hypothetical protein
MVTASGRRRHPGAAGGLLLLAACLLFLLPKASSSGQGRPPIQHALEHLPPPLAHMAFEEFAPSIQTFYERREHRPVWTDAAGRTPAGESLLRALQRANEDGLNPENYLVSSLAVPASADPAAMANLEILMSFAAARLAHDVGWGAGSRSGAGSLRAPGHRVSTRQRSPARSSGDRLGARLDDGLRGYGAAIRRSRATRSGAPDTAR